ncbi:hypothetical protein [Pseudoalteromonas sp. S558]|uniref:hypothetical protein n=1 Tax=Pseudoalteromonas sp. S558 TaxID=2066515 RepID=UPI00110C05D6|nr:hypothetical protein [Pseudoalteromonas sp. S558]TMO05491.1 hypothetical protein CWB66_06650 [Pseudoalteromonas sp. S558]
MKTLNKYKVELQSFISNNRLSIPDNVYSIDGQSPSWEDPVWYIKDPDTGVLHRYLCIKAKKGIKRESKDTIFRLKSNYASKLFHEPYATLLKIYTLAVQSMNIVNNSKQQRVVTACQILTEAQKHGCLNDVSVKFWSSSNLGNIFWDFCKKNKLISGRSRPIHKDRERGADVSAERSTKHLKMTSDSMIYALGDIFNIVFEHIDIDGTLRQGKEIDIQDAISITVALLGLASPNRLNSEIPLLQNQKLKTLRPKTGEPIYYLDWPGSKGFQDNQNHVLSVLEPHVRKAIGFFHYYFMPERHFIRFLKNRKQSWKAILQNFTIDKERVRYIDFKIPPNTFSVAYALGFYPVNYYIPIVKNSKYVCISDSGRKVKYLYMRKLNYETKRRYKVDDFFEHKHIAKLNLDDILLNTTGASSRNGVYAALKSKFINPIKRKELALPLITNVLSLEQAVFDVIKKEIPTFPLCYADSEQGIDMENALFCVSPAKHGITVAKGMAGSPLYIYPISKIKSLFLSRLHGHKKTSHLNIFSKYGFGYQKLRLHSLRHFSNTQAEKGGIPLSLIAAWSGRSSIKQTLEYIHTSDEDKTDRLISTLNLDDSEKDIRIISKEELKNSHTMPASVTETGVCVQELSVTPCNYINDFLSGCFGCESACYICGDQEAISMLQYDLEFQKVRLKKLNERSDGFVSKMDRDWWLKHSKGTYILKELISILKAHKHGSLVRISQDSKQFYITNLETKAISEHKLFLPSEKQLLEAFQVDSPDKISVPESMGLILNSFNLGK